ncbi:CPBP family intramembrane metalloprotease [Nonomuraea sp. 3-1Str]|uniref:CPBP family intramembrane glutamic endopeptidase n=1 Tax=Nonomuraea sp. 3-1Str TaxID=2929801 RepID=UPI00285E37D3|nr:type II CAAX endopeptidase family protein [Nonomuraea sp. 3-1Str]MDR8412707.1 CPBP family intramembrane metalloprotease [Nonomuraea sp. 3-1Str]
MQENSGPQLPYGTEPPGPVHQPWRAGSPESAPQPPAPAAPPYGAPPYPAHPGHPAYGAPLPQPVSWFAPTPSGARYDHLARTPLARPWRQIVGTLVVALGFLVVGVVVVLAGSVFATIAGLPMPITADESFGDPVFGMAVLLLSIAAVLPLVFGTAALVQQRRPGTLSSVAGRLRWPWLLSCAGVAVLALVLGQAAQAVALMLSGEDTSDMFGWAGWREFVPALIVIVLLVPFQAAAEEYIFRGWVLQALGAHVRNPAWAIVLGAALFASLHGYTGAGLFDVFAFGAVMGWLAVRTGGLEAPIALHVVNNMMAFGVSAAAGQLDDALRQGAVPWQALAGTVVQLGVFAGGVLYLAKKRSISVISDKYGDGVEESR